MSQALTPALSHRNVEMAALVVQGMAQKDIAKQYGISQQAVSKALATDDAVKHFIDTATRQQAELLPRVMENYREFLDPERCDDKTIRLKASQDIARNVGIAPSHAQSITINNIMQTNNIMADPEIMQALKQALLPAGDIIEVGL